MQRAVFLDRDGTLNAAVVREGRPYPPQNIEDVTLLDGVAAACSTLRNAGLMLVGITNQPDVARGTQRRDVVDAINARVIDLTGLTEIVVCDHDDDDNCYCRKPKPGMLLCAAERYDIDLKKSVTVGDRWRDVAAGSAAGTRTVFIDEGYAERRPHAPDLVVSNLKESVEWILAVTH